VDTRAKILSLEEVRYLDTPGLVLVASTFDLLRASFIEELQAIRQRMRTGLLVAAVLPSEEAFLSQPARVKMAAALRVIDYVVAIESGDLEPLIAALAPVEVACLEASDARRNRELIEHVRRQHSV